jgi:hypothetical protein
MAAKPAIAPVSSMTRDPMPARYTEGVLNRATYIQV